jgi:hypothetical protein
MNRWYICGVLSTAAVLIGASSVPAQANKGGNAGWLKDYPAARALARQTGKPMFLTFR